MYTKRDTDEVFVKVYPARMLQVAVSNNDTKDIIFWSLCLYADPKSNEVKSKGDKCIKAILSSLTRIGIRSVERNLAKLSKCKLVRLVNKNTIHIDSSYVSKVRYHVAPPLELKMDDNALDEYKRITSELKRNLVNIKKKRYLKRESVTINNLAKEKSKLETVIDIKDAEVKMLKARVLKVERDIAYLKSFIPPEELHKLRLIEGGKSY